MPIANLPLKDAPHQRVPVAHIFDIATDLVCGLPPIGMQALVDAKAYGQLLAPYAPKTAIGTPFTMEIIAAKNADGTTTIIKHFEAVVGKFPGAQAVSLCCGKPMLMDSATLGPRNVLKVLAYMLNQFGGTQIRRYTVVPVGIARAGRSADAMDRGYDHIIKNLPRHTENLAQTPWILVFGVEV